MHTVLGVLLTAVRWSRCVRAYRPIPQSIPQYFQTRPAPANATNLIDADRSNMSRTDQRWPIQQTPRNTN